MKNYTLETVYNDEIVAIYFYCWRGLQIRASKEPAKNLTPNRLLRSSQ